MLAYRHKKTSNCRKDIATRALCDLEFNCWNVKPWLLLLNLNTSNMEQFLKINLRKAREIGTWGTRLETFFLLEIIGSNETKFGRKTGTLYTTFPLQSFFSYLNSVRNSRWPRNLDSVEICFLLNNVVNFALIEIRTHNISGDRHWLHR
jgi:hypothetical protein